MIQKYKETVENTFMPVEINFSFTYTFTYMDNHQVSRYTGYHVHR